MINVFIDSHSLYFSAKEVYKKKINYSKLLNFLLDLGVEQTAIYITKSDDSVRFSKSMSNLGIIPLEREQDISSAPSYYMEMAMDMLRSEAKKKIICTSSLNVIPVIWEMNTLGYTTIVVGVNVPEAIKNICTCIEIPPSMMET